MDAVNLTAFGSQDTPAWIAKRQTPRGKHGSRARTPRGTLSKPCRRLDESLAAFDVRKAAHRAGAFNGGPIASGAERHAAQKALHGVKAAAKAEKQRRHKAQGRHGVERRSFSANETSTRSKAL